MNAITISGENVIIEAAEFDDMVKERANLRTEVNRLQRALQFWLPHVPAEGPEEILERVGDDAMLLFGHDGDERSAETIGWITLRTTAEREAK